MDLRKLLDSELTHEMIASQLDVKFIDELKPKISRMKDIININDIRDNSVLLERFPEANDLLNDINTILSKRFKFNVKILLANTKGASTNIIMPGSFNVLYNNNDWINGLKKYYESKKNQTFKNLKDVNDFNKNIDDYYHQIYKNVLAMERELDKFNITIDNKNATITGLPKDFYMLFKIDFCFMLNTYGNNDFADNFIAILLHEIGHNYTGFEKAYYGVKNSITLLEATRETLNSGIKDETQILRVINKKMGIGTNGTKGELLLNLRNKMLPSTEEMDLLAQTQSEQQADQFVSRFGLGGTLASSLVKNSAWIRYSNPDMDQKLADDVLIVNILSIGSFILVGSFTALGAIAVGVTVFMSGLLWLHSTLKSYEGKANNFFKNKSPYELDYQRVLRLKQDAIRQLRLLDKKDDKILVNRLMDNIVILDERLSFINSIMEEAKKDIFKKWMMENQFDPKSNSILTMNNLVQDLMENNLHIKTKQL
jgi:hypothetical protein